MDQAVSPIGDKVGLGIAPAAECGRPFLGPPQIEELRTAGDHRAVGDSGVHRRHLARRDPDHDLVQQSHAGGTLALHDQTHALAEARHRHQVGVVEALADCDAFGEGGPGPLRRLRPTSAQRRSRCAATPVLRTRRSLPVRVHRARTIPAPVPSRLGTSEQTRSGRRSGRLAADRRDRIASWWARVHASVDSSSCPVRYAASASFSRSSRSSGVAASAAANCAYASPHERRAKDARACSSTPIVITGPVWRRDAQLAAIEREPGQAGRHRAGGRRRAGAGSRFQGGPHESNPTGPLAAGDHRRCSSRRAARQACEISARSLPRLGTDVPAAEYPRDVDEAVSVRARIGHRDLADAMAAELGHRPQHRELESC